MQGAVKGARHYRYYVSRGLVRGSLQDDQRGWRVAAPELERAVRAATQQILGDRTAIAGAIEEFDIDASRLPSIFKAAEAWIQSLRSEAEASSGLVRLIDRVELKQAGIQVSIKLPIPSDEGRGAATPNELALARFVPMRMKRRGVEMRLIMVTQRRPASIYRCSTRPPARIDGPTICWRAGRNRSARSPSENILRPVTCAA